MGKSRLRDKVETLAKTDRFYHWYDESLLSGLEVNGDVLRRLLRPFASEGFSGQITKRQREKFLRIMRKDTASIPIRVATLLEMCELLHISPEALERMKLFKREYPISLDQHQIYRLMTHIINEGSIRKGRYPRGYYCNLDLSLHDRVSGLITSLGGHGNRRMGKDNVPETYISTAIVKLLVKGGLVPGKKTRGQYLCHLPKQILDNPELSKYHMSATLTEEGSASLRLNEGSRPSISIRYSRSIDVTDLLPYEYVHNMKQGMKYPIRPLPNEAIARLVLQLFPPLEDEIMILKDRYGIKVRSYPASLYKSKQDRVTTEWCVSIHGVDAVTRFIDRIGFLPGSNVEMRYELIWSLYQKYKDKVLNQEDIDELQKELGST